MFAMTREGSARRRCTGSAAKPKLCHCEPVRTPAWRSVSVKPVGTVKAGSVSLPAFGFVLVAEEIQPALWKRAYSCHTGDVGHSRAVFAARFPRVGMFAMTREGSACRRFGSAAKPKLCHCEPVRTPARQSVFSFILSFLYPMTTRTAHSVPSAASGRTVPATGLPSTVTDFTPYSTPSGFSTVMR